MRGGTFERELAEARRVDDWMRAELADVKRSLALRGIADRGWNGVTKASPAIR